MQMTKIFGIGLMKTGTSSLSQALKDLGYKGHHYYKSPDEFYKKIKDLDFAVDMPTQTRYQELDKKYPGSKFILTIRDEKPWLNSCKKWIETRNWDERNENHSKAKTKELGEGAINQVLLTRREEFGIDNFNEKIFKKVYKEHHKKIKEYFKDRPQDLLIINICNSEGWEKLCPFLNKPIPNQPFPKANVNKVK